jgi:hypothetical protein
MTVSSTPTHVAVHLAVLLSESPLHPQPAGALVRRQTGGSGVSPEDIPSYCQKGTSDARKGSLRLH